MQRACTHSLVSLQTSAILDIQRVCGDQFQTPISFDTGVYLRKISFGGSVTSRATTYWEVESLFQTQVTEDYFAI